MSSVPLFSDFCVICVSLGKVKLNQPSVFSHDFLATIKMKERPFFTVCPFSSGFGDIDTHYLNLRYIPH